MSWQHSHTVVAHLHTAVAGSDKGRTTKLLLLCMADHAGQDGLVWCGYEALIQETGLSDRTIRRHIAQAIQNDDLEQVSPGHRGNRAMWRMPVRCEDNACRKADAGDRKADTSQSKAGLTTVESRSDDGRKPVGGDPPNSAPGPKEPVNDDRNGRSASPTPIRSRRGEEEQEDVEQCDLCHGRGIAMIDEHGRERPCLKCSGAKHSEVSPFQRDALETSIPNRPALGQYRGQRPAALEAGRAQREAAEAQLNGSGDAALSDGPSNAERPVAAEAEMAERAGR